MLLTATVGAFLSAVYLVSGSLYAAMAKKFKIPPGTVMSRLFKAKQLLRKSWEMNNR